jgi:hypothetical protein
MVALAFSITLQSEERHKTTKELVKDNKANAFTFLVLQVSYAPIDSFSLLPAHERGH